MRLILITLFLAIGLGVCSSQDGDDILDYVSELSARSVILPNERDLCFYHRVPSYWAGDWDVEFYHLSKNKPAVTMIMNGPYGDEGWEAGSNLAVTRWSTNFTTFKATVKSLMDTPPYPVGSTQWKRYLSPGMYSLCFRNRSTRPETVILWFDVNPRLDTLMSFTGIYDKDKLRTKEDHLLPKSGDSPQDDSQKHDDLERVRLLINKIELEFYDLEKKQLLRGKHAEHQYSVLSYVNTQIAFIYVFEICLFLGVTIGQILIVKTWFRRR